MTIKNKFNTLKFYIKLNGQTRYEIGNNKGIQRKQITHFSKNVFQAIVKTIN